MPIETDFKVGNESFSAKIKLSLNVLVDLITDFYSKTPRNGKFIKFNERTLSSKIPGSQCTSSEAPSNHLCAPCDHDGVPIGNSEVCECQEPKPFTKYDQESQSVCCSSKPPPCYSCNFLMNSPSEVLHQGPCECPSHTKKVIQFYGDQETGECCACE